MKDDPLLDWTPWDYRRPPATQLVEIMRAEWPAPSTIRAIDIPPYANIYGLYWRPIVEQAE